MSGFFKLHNHLLPAFTRISHNSARLARAIDPNWVLLTFLLGNHLLFVQVKLQWIVTPSIHTGSRVSALCASALRCECCLHPVRSENWHWL